MFTPILAYHKVQPTFELGIAYNTPEQFEKQVRYLYENNFKCLSILDYVNNHRNAERNIVITFDDAYDSVYENALPILSKYGFTATVFVITKFVGQLNTWDYHFKRFRFPHSDWSHVREMFNEGWEVGSHTVSHPNLPRLSRNRLWHEIKYSKEILENQLGTEVAVFSYPFGLHNEAVVDCVRKAGFQAACTLGYNYPYNQSFPFALFRRGVYRIEPLRLFKTKLSNSYFAHCDDFKQRLISLASKSTLFLRFLGGSSKSA